MASNDKLWFELGVRDDITKTLDKILSKATDVERALSIIGKDPLIPGIKNSYDNVEKLEKAIEGISNALRTVKTTKLEITNPNDISNLNKMQLALGQMRKRIHNFLNETRKNPLALGEKGLAEGFLTSIGYCTAISQVSTRTREYTQNARRKEVRWPERHSASMVSLKGRCRFNLRHERLLRQYAVVFRRCKLHLRT